MKNKQTLILEILIEWFSLGKRTIPIKAFPFLQIERQLIPLYLNKLKELGCFLRWTTNPFKSEANGEIIFDGVNLSIISKLIEGQVQKSDKKFWFEEKVFNFRFPDGSIRQIDFSPKRNENHIPDPFYLLQALVNFSRKDGSFVDNRIEVHINREELINKIKNDYPKPEKITLDWIKNTKRNLISMIPIEYRDLINLSNFNRKEREY